MALHSCFEKAAREGAWSGDQPCAIPVMNFRSGIEPLNLGVASIAKPVRDVRRRSDRQSWRGFSTSRQNATVSKGFCDSLLEKNQHILLSTDSGVARFAVHPDHLNHTAFDKQGWAFALPTLLEAREQDLTRRGNDTPADVSRRGSQCHSLAQKPVEQLEALASNGRRKRPQPARES